MNLFIDIDGVLLGKCPNTKQPIIANHATELLKVGLKKFDCYWLTTHCKGSAETAVDYLRPYADDEFLSLIQQIRPTNFKTFKIEALFGDFLWIDDQPTAYEFQFLDENNLLDCWLQVNTRQNINDLTTIMENLQKA